MNWKRSRIIFTVVILFSVVSIMSIFLFKQVQAQNSIISQLSNRLTQQKIPIKHIDIVNRLPLQLEVIIQSESNTEIIAPNDPFFKHAVLREVNFLPKQIINVNTVKIIIVNVKNQPIYWADELVAQNISADITSSSATNNTDITNLITSQIALYEMSLDALDVFSDLNGGQILTIQLSVANIEIANKAIASFMMDLRALVESINQQNNTKIIVYKINLVNAEDEPLLNYVRDIQLANETWWQADNLTQDWFPHPPLSPK